jgi:putative ABC transport system permease protein
VTLLTVVAFGVAPALRFAAISPNLALRQQSRSSTGTSSQSRIRSGLAALQLAPALTLLVGAGVLLARFRQLQQVNLEFRVERVLTFDVSLPSARYDAARRAAFQEDLARRIAAIPGVRAADGTSRFPATGSYHPWITQIETGPLAGTPVRRTQQRTVSGDFFRALEIPLRAGRTFISVPAGPFRPRRARRSRESARRQAR